MPPIPGEKIIQQSVGTALRRMSPAAISIGMCSVFFAVSAVVVIFALGPVYLDAQRITADAEHMHDAHEECQRRLKSLEEKVALLESRRIASH